jgi:hypothetical protein
MAEQEAETDDRVTSATAHKYIDGEKYRVVKSGCSLVGLQRHDNGGYRGWSRPLPAGSIITCAGRRELMFGDGAVGIKWKGEHGEPLAVDCEFYPSEAAHPMFPVPKAGCLELLQ